MQHRAPLWQRAVPAGIPTRFEGDSLLVVNWLNGIWQVFNARHAYGSTRVSASSNSLPYLM